MMANTNREVVVGVFEDRAQAEQAVQALRDAGFNEDQIGYAVRDNNAGGVEATVEDGGRDAGGGAATGVVSGGVLGGIIGAGMALLVPGFGPAIAGGILAATLGGAAVGAAAGGLLGALTGMGIPEHEARYYNSEFEAGRVIVTVRAGAREQEAMSLLRQYGAYDAETRGAGGAASGTTAYMGDDNYGQSTTTTTQTTTSREQTYSQDADTNTNYNANP